MKNKKGGAGTVVLITLGVIVLLFLMIGGWIGGTYNGLVKSDTTVQNAFGNVQTALQRQADLIPNLVATVKGASNFEQVTQTQIAGLRSGIKNAKTPSDLDKVNTQMNSMISGLTISVEAYPNLKATEQYQGLSDELAGTQNRIKFERDNYNSVVKDYQVNVRSFPSNIIANLFGFRSDRWTTFQGTDNAQETPVVNFSN